MFPSVLPQWDQDPSIAAVGLVNGQEVSDVWGINRRRDQEV